MTEGVVSGVVSSDRCRNVFNLVFESSSLTAHAGLTRRGRWSRGTKTLATRGSRAQILVNAHVPIKDGSVFSRFQLIFAWTGKTDSKTQRVDADLFETGESSPFINKNRYVWTWPWLFPSRK